MSLACPTDLHARQTCGATCRCTSSSGVDIFRCAWCGAAAHVQRELPNTVVERDLYQGLSWPAPFLMPQRPLTVALVIPRRSSVAVLKALYQTVLTPLRSHRARLQVRRAFGSQCQADESLVITASTRSLAHGRIRSGQALRASLSQTLGC